MTEVFEGKSGSGLEGEGCNCYREQPWGCEVVRRQAWGVRVTIFPARRSTNLTWPSSKLQKKQRNAWITEARWLTNSEKQFTPPGASLFTIFNGAELLASSQPSAILVLLRQARRRTEERFPRLHCSCADFDRRVLTFQGEDRQVLSRCSALFLARDFVGYIFQLCDRWYGCAGDGEFCGRVGKF